MEKNQTLPEVEHPQSPVFDYCPTPATEGVIFYIEVEEEKKEEKPSIVSRFLHGLRSLFAQTARDIRGVN